MNNLEFQNQIQRLIGVYGDKSYPHTRVEMLWREFRNTQLSEFTDIVDELIVTSQYAPLAPKFREAKADLYMKNASRYQAEEREWIEKQPNCGHCDKSGAVLAVKKTDGNTYAFQCFCPIGPKLHPRITRWHHGRDKEYQRLGEKNSHSFGLPEKAVERKITAPIDDGMKSLGSVLPKMPTHIPIEHDLSEYDAND